MNMQEFIERRRKETRELFMHCNLSNKNDLLLKTNVCYLGTIF